ncbi:MAG TPA: divergent PAP2 family protein [Methylomusa anaerophila]|uniref:Divergent PAP2 family protein n=1 Tax=Methylomusa anaerophila TaxID=1930071 RepID=A0A348APC5_9FIRM|nr:divergent PAP2 family protein [Methylomusa anaerophila]BBB92923.1 divergent PAP2 family protein [Methylomusa anaerophila]HML87242.1 divergent PAP2 family protein [Methylomusa anaerophila]
MTDLFLAIGKNIVLLSATTAWFTAQILKALTSYWRHGEFNAERLVGAGGMPSSHTALVAGLSSSIAFHDGIDSPLFALSIVLAGIVMYDAAGVRRAAGKQAKVINKLVREMRVDHTVKDTRLKELLGHTPLEVLAGAIHGFVVAYGFYTFYR